jgi:hypothetical protein
VSFKGVRRELKRLLHIVMIVLGDSRQWHDQDAVRE